MTIVGIVKDVRTRGPSRPVQAELFMPYEQHQGPATSLNIVMRDRRGAIRWRIGDDRDDARSAAAIRKCRCASRRWR